jgi:hypothetical protein
VVPRVQRAADPLQPARRPDDRVARHGVVRGAVQIVAPLVDLRRPRLDEFFRGRLPAIRDKDRDTAGAEDAQEFFLGNRGRTIDHDQIDQIVDVWQPSSIQPVDRHGPVKSSFAQRLAGRRHIVRVSIQPVNHIAVAGPQGGRQPAVAAAQVDHQAAPHAADLEDLASLLGRIHSLRNWRCLQRQRANQQQVQKSGIHEDTPACAS